MTPLLQAAWIVPGFLLGALHFHGLGRNTALYMAGHAGRAVALQLLRMAITVVGLVLAASQGAWPLLAAATGFLLARLFLVRPPTSEARDRG